MTIFKWENNFNYTDYTFHQIDGIYWHLLGGLFELIL